MKCKHKKKPKIVITAKEIKTKCPDCKEILVVRRRVLSSSIYAIGRVGKNTEVQFIRKGGPGKVYVHYNVPRDLHDKFLDARSKGLFYSEMIKDEYDVDKLD